MSIDEGTSLKDAIDAFQHQMAAQVPGTFVLDREGVVQLASVDPDYTKRLEPSAILAALRSASS